MGFLCGGVGVGVVCCSQLCDHTMVVKVKMKWYVKRNELEGSNVLVNVAFGLSKRRLGGRICSVTSSVMGALPRRILARRSWQQ